MTYFRRFRRLGKRGGERRVLRHRGRSELTAHRRVATHAAPVSNRPVPIRRSRCRSVRTPACVRRVVVAERAVRPRPRGRRARHLTAYGAGGVRVQSKPRRRRRRPGDGPRTEHARPHPARPRPRRSQQPRRRAAELLVPARRPTAPSKRRAHPRLFPSAVGGRSRHVAPGARLGPAPRVPVCAIRAVRPVRVERRLTQHRVQQRVRGFDTRRDERLLRHARDPRARILRQLHELLEEVDVEPAADARGIRARERVCARGGTLTSSISIRVSVRG